MNPVQPRSVSATEVVERPADDTTASRDLMLEMPTKFDDGDVDVVEMSTDLMIEMRTKLMIDMSTYLTIEILTDLV